MFLEAQATCKFRGPILLQEAGTYTSIAHHIVVDRTILGPGKMV